jgi:hypothetical protein
LGEDVYSANIEVLRALREELVVVQQKFVTEKTILKNRIVVLENIFKTELGYDNKDMEYIA